MALLGDAAYAAPLASGQGTSLALVGAYVLAQKLRSASDYSRAFQAYESTLRPFVGANKQLAAGNLEGMVPKTLAAIALQTLMPYLPGKSYIVRRITEPIQKAANALELATL